MNPNDRNPWQGLNTAQLAELDAALTRPERVQLNPVEVYDQLSHEYGMRAARMLVANDLRGAMYAAEISEAAERMATGQQRAMEVAREAINRMREIAAQDPAGRLVHIPGHKKRKRVKPFPADGPSD
jgi:hypothetical protein